MLEDRQGRAKELFHQALELPQEERGLFLTQECGTDSATRAEVEALLNHDGLAPPAFLGRAAYAPQPEKETKPLPIPERVGRYRIIRLLGRGGMGTVYEAEQEQPSRRVALKVITEGMDTHKVVTRFEQERQALALMEHPNIARVLDAGATESGRPYFVMEFCAGAPITEFCDANRLSIPERLALFVQVCQAVQHAHQKALIHRDLKPSNLLVAMQDGRPQAKVIDFGIAKATAGRLIDATLVTGLRQLIGTPEYMSPEQAEGSRDIDTRTDVYSLGILLYELLTSCTPFSGKDLRDASFAEIQRIIRDVDPPRPSTRVRLATKSIGDIASARGAAPKKFPALLRGELDWIVMKAIEKDRGRRYESAGALAADIEHYLAGEVILAAPPRASYRLRKFVVRNRQLVIGSAVTAIALMVGLAGTLWQANVARREARSARAAENDARRIAEFQAEMLEQIDTTSAGDELLAHVRTQFERGIAKGKFSPEVQVTKIAEFEEQLRQLNPTDLAAGLIDTTILRPSIDSIARQFSEQPVVEASLNQTLATLYRTIGRYSEARPLQERALATRKRVLGESHPDTLDSMQALGYQMRLQGDLPGAEVLLSETLARCKAALGPDHPITLTAQSTCGGILRLKKQFPEAEACWRDVLERRRRVLGQDNQYTLISINNMGAVLQDQGKLAEAEIYFREALERGRRALGPDSPNTLITQNFLGGLLWQQNRLDEAESIHRETMEKRRRILGELHPRTINSIANLGELLFAAGKNAEAEPLLREAMEKRRRVLGANHSLTLESTGILARLLESQDRLIEAEPLLREMVERRDQDGGRQDLEPRRERIHLARVLTGLGRFVDAEKVLAEARCADGTTNGMPAGPARQCIEAMIALYDAWERAEPGKGYDLKARTYRAKLHQAGATSEPRTEMNP